MLSTNGKGCRQKWSTDVFVDKGCRQITNLLLVDKKSSSCRQITNVVDKSILWSTKLSTNSICRYFSQPKVLPDPHFLLSTPIDRIRKRKHQQINLSTGFCYLSTNVVDKCCQQTMSTNVDNKCCQRMLSTDVVNRCC